MNNKFYAIVNDEIIVTSSLSDVVDMCHGLEDDDSVTYLEYGLFRPDNWDGRLSLVILKNEEA